MQAGCFIPKTSVSLSDVITFAKVPVYIFWISATIASGNLYALRIFIRIPRWMLSNAFLKSINSMTQLLCFSIFENSAVSKDVGSSRFPMSEVVLQ